MPAPVVPSNEDEALHREMERVSLDWVMIYNPTDEDFYIEWAAKDGRPWKYLVSNKKKDIGWGLGKLEVQRYLAIWYCKHMKDKIVNDKGDKLAEELTKFEEQAKIWGKTPRTTSEKELASLYPILFLGITREFGMDYAPSGQQGIDQTTSEEKVYDTLKNKKYETETTEDEPASEPQLKPKAKKEALQIGRA